MALYVGPVYTNGCLLSLLHLQAILWEYVIGLSVSAEKNTLRVKISSLTGRLSLAPA